MHLPENAEHSSGLVAVVPVYDNATTVEVLAQRLHRALDPVLPAHEILFVADHGPSADLEALDRLARADDRIRVLMLDRNVGQHAAVMIGLAHVGDRAWTVILDADLQDPPEVIPDLWHLAQARGVEVVFAARRGLYQSRLRMFSSRLFKRLLSFVAGVPRDAGMFMLLRRSAVEKLLELPTERPFVVAMVGCAGLSVASLPVERDRRADGRSAYRGLARWRSAQKAFLCAWDCRKGSRKDRKGSRKATEKNPWHRYDVFIHESRPSEWAPEVVVDRRSATNGNALPDSDQPEAHKPVDDRPDAR